MDKSFKLTILHTSDTHGCLLNEDYSHNVRVSSGMNIIANLIKSQKTKNTILIDTGDAIQGSPLLYFHQINQHKYPNPVAAVFNYIDYDYYVPGNHDFNYGMSYLEHFIHSLKARTLCGNILNESGEPLFEKAYDIKEFPGGPKIAVIGITTQYIPNWESPENIKSFQFVHAVTKCQEIVAEIKEKHHPDFMILGYHGGVECDLDTGERLVADTGENLGFQILEKIPEIDIVLTGHQHRIICKKKNHTIVTQPGGSAQFVGKVEVEFEQNEQWEVKTMKAAMLSAAGYAPDPRISELIANVESETQKFLDRTIGVVPDDDLHITDPFSARRYKHKIVTLINLVQLRASQAQISCTSLGNDVTGFDKTITIRNILSTYVYPNTLVVVKITGQALREALEKNAEYFAIDNGKIVVNPRFCFPKPEHYNYDMFDGIDYTFDISQPIGRRVVKLSRAGQNILPDQEFSLVMNNYRATGGGDFHMYRGLPVLKEISMDIAELLINYIREQKEIRVPDPQNISVVLNGK